MERVPQRLIPRKDREALDKQYVILAAVGIRAELYQIQEQFCMIVGAEPAIVEFIIGDHHEVSFAFLIDPNGDAIVIGKLGRGRAFFFTQAGEICLNLQWIGKTRDADHRDPRGWFFTGCSDRRG